jgi:hypothetical protein
MRHEESSYLGCLLFDDTGFCDQIAKLLQGYCNRSIAEIGSLDLSYILQNPQPATKPTAHRA